MITRPRSMLFLGSLFLVLLLYLSPNAQARAQSESPSDQEPENTGQSSSQFLFLPFLEIATPPPVGESEILLFCNAPGKSIPDNTYPGISDSLIISDIRFIWDLNLFLDIQHEWSGDIVVELTHLETGKALTVMDRPGDPARTDGCNKPNIYSFLDDEMTLPVENECEGNPPLGSGMTAISGGFKPNAPLQLFDGDSLFGTWQLTVSDVDEFNDGELNSWCMIATVNTAPPAPQEPPPAPELPARAYVQGVRGFNQKYHLDCETRAAVDWAAFFGFNINEDQFFNRLKKSDNPDKGFVGNVHGTWGKTPPNDYGVHAEPVAKLLREYGVEAYAHRPYGWNELRAEIAAGRPVYVFVAGSGTEETAAYSYIRSGRPILYTSSDGHTTIVAPYEHTVMVVGYDPAYVTIRDGAREYKVPVNRFLRSWSALGNMAITTHP